MWKIDEFDIATEMNDNAPTTKERAKKANKAVSGYSYSSPPDPEAYTGLSDGVVNLLMDQIHLCNREKLEFLGLFETTERHFDVETGAAINKSCLHL